MKKNILIIIALMAFPVWAFPACSNYTNEVFSSGVTGKHELKRMKRMNSIKGTIAGNFFLGSGEIKGNLGNELNLIFSWEQKPGLIIITTLPYSKFLFRIDNTIETPTIEFEFTDTFWRGIKRNTNSIDKIMEELSNLNRIVMSEYLLYARIIISEKDFENEIFLPKLR